MYTWEQFLREFPTLDENALVSHKLYLERRKQVPLSPQLQAQTNYPVAIEELRQCASQNKQLKSKILELKRDIDNLQDASEIYAPL